MKTYRNYLMAATVLLLTACQKSTPTPTPLPPLTTSQQVQNNNQFAWNLYKEVVDETENQLLSPYSISTALAMVYAGADGNTATQMQQVFGFGANNATFHQDFNQLKLDLQSNINRPSNSQFKVVNQLWRNNQINFLPTFETTMQNEYAAPVLARSFETPTLIRQEINDWVEQETNQMIQDFLPQGFVKTNTATVLVNALYLSADWEVPFDVNRTSPQSFQASTGSTTVDMMTSLIPCSNLKYTQNSSVEVLELYLKDRATAITLILPQTAGINTLVQNTSHTQLEQWLDSLATPNAGNSNFSIYLPKFDFTSSRSVIEPLKGMGMTDAFSTVADFSKMANGRLQIGAIQHKAAIKLHESGVEAAAATAAGIFVTSVPPVERVVNINKPFIMLIREVETGSILFVGHVDNPNL